MRVALSCIGSREDLVVHQNQRSRAHSEFKQNEGAHSVHACQNTASQAYTNSVTVLGHQGMLGLLPCPYESDVGYELAVLLRTAQRACRRALSSQEGAHPAVSIKHDLMRGARCALRAL